MVWALLLGVLSLAHTTRAVQEAWSSQPSTLQISSQGGNDDCALHLGPLFAAPQWREERASADAWAQADVPTTSQDSDEAYIAELTNELVDNWLDTIAQGGDLISAACPLSQPLQLQTRDPVSQLFASLTTISGSAPQLPASISYSVHPVRLQKPSAGQAAISAADELYTADEDYSAGYPSVPGTEPDSPWPSALPSDWLASNGPTSVRETDLEWLDMALEQVYQERAEQYTLAELAAAASREPQTTPVITNLLSQEVGSWSAYTGFRSLPTLRIPNPYASAARAAQNGAGWTVTAEDGSSLTSAGAAFGASVDEDAAVSTGTWQESVAGHSGGGPTRRLQQISGTATNAVSGVVQRNIAFNCSTLIPLGLEACAEALCADVFSLVRFNHGSIRCVLTNPQTNTGTTQTIIVAPYAYSYFFDFQQNVVLFGFSAGLDFQSVVRARTREPTGNDFYDYLVRTLNARAALGALQAWDFANVDSLDRPFLSFGVNTVQPFTYNTRISPLVEINVRQRRSVAPGLSTQLLSVLPSVQYTVFGGTGLPWLP